MSELETVYPLHVQLEWGKARMLTIPIVVFNI